MNVILFDDPTIRLNLYPFTLTRPVGAIRVGILTIAEKWERWLKAPVSFQTENYLSGKFGRQDSNDDLLINGALCPDADLKATINALPQGYFLVKDTILLAARKPQGAMTERNVVAYKNGVTLIDQVWKIFGQNAAQLRTDFVLVTAGRKSAGIHDPHTRIYNSADIFVEEGVYIKGAILNAETGPIYLGKNSVVQEGAIIRGAFALCEGGHLNMGAKMRGDITVGPWCKVGGEVSNSVLFAHSNKAHDGYIGNAVIGEWCNLGAGTCASNLKNNYSSIKIWSHARETMISTDLQFCGLMMGDHSKAAINTAFNTATVVGVSANVYGSGFPPSFVPSFSWGGGEGLTTYRLEKAISTARMVMSRREVDIDRLDKAILEVVFKMTSPGRTWEVEA
ncbi:MAG TPA: GlmU family protein [Chryseolinea sp.]|nr:GlmU family protein [Chryseolinea sp.]